MSDFNQNICNTKYKSQKLKLPNGWMNCPNYSLTIIADTFVALKTPLDHKYDNKISTLHRFDTNMLFSELSKKKINIGLLIDLTNTDRYYDQYEVKNMGCIYEKIPCEGHQKPPTYKQVQSFLNICSKFIAENHGQYIGVHCTHGFNRTGFMIVTYLIEKLGFNITNAIAQFAAARPPGIYKQNKINELFRRYSDKKPILVPKLPIWAVENKNLKRVSNQYGGSNQWRKNMNKHSYEELDSSESIHPFFMAGHGNNAQSIGKVKITNSFNNRPYSDSYNNLYNNNSYNNNLHSNLYNNNLYNNSYNNTDINNSYNNNLHSNLYNNNLYNNTDINNSYNNTDINNSYNNTDINNSYNNNLHSNLYNNNSYNVPHRNLYNNNDYRNVDDTSNYNYDQNDFGRKVCYNCKQPGHYKRDCKLPSQQVFDRLQSRDIIEQPNTVQINSRFKYFK